ncbi:hypothetical protein K7432_016270 [Basidiobolus ranarum]|uniref:SET domain-containing protein n=1 Tax=Basidiobolus ranarum TaxID=34480 RepID=A0ABR2VLU9_9FUNG
MTTLTNSSSSLPVNWPKDVEYLTEYRYHPSISSDLLDVIQGKRQLKAQSISANVEKSVNSSNKSQDKKQNSDSVTGSSTVIDRVMQDEQLPKRTELELEYDEIPIGRLLTVPTLPNGHDSPLYEIRLITSPPTHPVLNSYGLFACTTLRPGALLLDYIAEVLPDNVTDPESDYTLHLLDCLNLDACKAGNQGRFVNDFRQIRTQEQGPNVAWDLYRCETSGQVRMGCKILKRIEKDEELLCTYGKLFWKSRGIPVKGEEWEDGWDTESDIEDASD